MVVDSADPGPAARSALLRAAHRTRPSVARGPESFYGWHVVAVSAAVLVCTAPGQTAAVSAFVDPMIRDLGVSRSALATAYLIGTLTGALAMPWAGRLIDTHGARRSMLVVAGLFGAVLVAMSAVAGPTGLTLGFVGIRMLGQGALGLTATLAASSWFDQRRGLALSIVAAIGATGISLAPLVVERLIAAQGWRTVWVIEGIFVWVVVLPLAALVMRDRPEQVGQRPDGVRRSGRPPRPRWGLRLREAARSPFFWVVTAGVGTSGMLSTAVAFHQISILGERGLSSTEAAANFLPQTAAGIVATLLVGVVVDRVAPRWIVGAAMVSLAVGLAWGVVVTPGLSAVGFGLAIGSAGASIRAFEAAAMPRFFGTAHVGALRGFVAAVSVGSTAFGPLAFALGRDAAGGYAPVLLASAGLPLVVLGAAFLTSPPASSDAAVRHDH